jgi:hypothetical protein
MPYVPGWFRPWCEANSLNADRAALWPEAAQAAFQAEKLRRFRLHWAWLSKIGQPAIIRTMSGRAELIRQVRRELDDALAPCPVSLGRHAQTSPYRKAEAWNEAEILATYEIRTYPDGSRELILPPRPSLAERKMAKLDPWKQIPIENVIAWVEQKPERVTMSETIARCLYWLETEFSSRPGEGKGAGSVPVPSHAGARPSGVHPDLHAGVAPAH